MLERPARTERRRRRPDAGEPLADKYMHAEFRSDYAVIFATDQLTEVGAPPLNPGPARAADRDAP